MPRSVRKLSDIWAPGSGITDSKSLTNDLASLVIRSLVSSPRSNLASTCSTAVSMFRRFFRWRSTSRPISALMYETTKRRLSTCFSNGLNSWRSISRGLAPSFLRQSSDDPIDSTT